MGHRLAVVRILGEPVVHNRLWVASAAPLARRALFGLLSVFTSFLGLLLLSSLRSGTVLTITLFSIAFLLALTGTLSEMYTLVRFGSLTLVDFGNALERLRSHPRTRLDFLGCTVRYRRVAVAAAAWVVAVLVEAYRHDQRWEGRVE